MAVHSGVLVLLSAVALQLLSPSLPYNSSFGCFLGLSNAFALPLPSSSANTIGRRNSSVASSSTGAGGKKEKNHRGNDKEVNHPSLLLRPTPPQNMERRRTTTFMSSTTNDDNSDGGDVVASSASTSTGDGLVQSSTSDTKDDEEEKKVSSGRNSNPLGGASSSVVAVSGGGGQVSPKLSGGDDSEKKAKLSTILFGGGVLSDPRRLSVAIVLVSAFLNLLGFTMAGPITPALGQHFGLSIGASFGSLTSAYPLGMLLGLFLWPQLSDKIGRKPVITVSLLGSGLGLAAQSYAVKARWSLGVFLGTRVLTGSFAGASPVSKAYLADVGSAEGKLPRYLALRDACSTMAFIVGPLLGGVVFDIRRKLIGAAGGGGGVAKAAASATAAASDASLTFVIGVSAVASLIAAALVGAFVAPMVVPDASEVAETGKTNKGGKSSSETKFDSTDLLSCPLGSRIWTGVASVCVVSFLFNVGDSTFHAFFSALMRDGWGLDAHSIGLAYTAFACISFTVSATLASRSIRTLGPALTCATGLSLVGTGLVALAYSAVSNVSAALTSASGVALVMGAAGLYYCGVPLYGPTIPTMLLRCVPPNRRGAVMGLDGAINTLARVFSPLIMGDLYRRSGPGAAFGAAGIAVWIAAMTTLFRRLVVLRGQRVLVDDGGGGRDVGGDEKKGKKAVPVKVA